MKGIRQELDQAIKKEVSAKIHRQAAKEIIEHRRPVTRAAIEEIKEAAELKRMLDLDLVWLTW